MKDKRGWIRIVEAFTAVLIIIGVVLVILDQGYEREDPSERVYEIENAILKEIQLNDSLRNETISATGPLPINWTNVNFPSMIKDKINEKPAYLNCTAQICEIADDCVLNNLPEQNVYVRSVAITSTLTAYDARQLKLFCWFDE